MQKIVGVKNLIPIDEYGNPHTSVDEDMRSRLEAKLIEQVLNFKVA